MVSSSAITIASDGERLTCGGFSLSEAVRLGNFEFITDYFGALSLSPRRGDVRAAFIGPTRSGAPIPRRAMMEDSAEEFLMTSSGEGSFGLPSPRRRGMVALPAHVTTTPKMENALAAQAMTTVPPWMVAPRPETCLPFERHHAHHGGSRHKPTTKQWVAPRRRKLTGKQATSTVQLQAERILMVDFASSQA
jgi:hypothetical protein